MGLGETPAGGVLGGGLVLKSGAGPGAEGTVAKEQLLVGHREVQIGWKEGKSGRQAGFSEI